MYHNTRMYTAIPSIICASLVFVGSAAAQCNPPGPNTKCWDNEAGNGLWSFDLNWDPNGPPLSTDDVFHLIGGTITMNMGSFANPVPIKSFTFEVPGGLSIDAGRGLLVEGAFSEGLFRSGGAPPAQPYGLTVNAGAKLKVIGDLDFVSAVVPDATAGSRTLIDVGGVTRAADWTLGAFTDVVALGGIDLSAFVNSNLWVIKGDVLVIGPIVGAYDWTVVAAGATNTPRIEVQRGSMDVDKLTVESGATVLLTQTSGIPTTLNIGEMLLIDGGVVTTEFANLDAEPLSVVVLTGGGTLQLADFGSFFRSEFAKLEYGDPGTSGNRLETGGALSLRGYSTFAPVQGVAGSMTFLVDDELFIQSRIHAEASAWDSSGVDLRVFGANDTQRKIEVTSPDFNGIWFADSSCIKPWKSFEIDCVGFPCVFWTVDEQANSNPFVIQQTGNPEAMYVDGDVTLHDLSFLWPVDARKVYYNGTLFGPEMTDPPISFVFKSLYGDWNNDCLITEDERTALLRIIVGLDPYDPLFDLDCDGVITSPTEQARFNENIDNQFGALPELCVLCDAAQDCGDRLDNATGNLPSDGIRDDNCVWVGCDFPPDGSCNLIDIIFADAGGDFGACSPNGFCNFHDRNHVLTCFGGTNLCDDINMDLGGSYGACPPDGYCNIHDANHALTCFAGTNSCSCPGGSPAAMQGPGDGGATGLVAVPVPASVAPNVRRVRIFTTGAVADIQGYQLDPIVSGGTGGQLELLDITIEPRADFVFAGRTDTYEAFNLTNGQMLCGLDGDGVATTGPAYLATYTYRVPLTAAGDFVLDIRRDEAAGDQTFMIASGNGRIEVSATTPGVVSASPAVVP